MTRVDEALGHALFNSDVDRICLEYHSELAEFNKRCISTEFANPDMEDVLESLIYRIIIATNAIEMGIDNPDVQLVVQ